MDPDTLTLTDAQRCHICHMPPPPPGPPLAPLALRSSKDESKFRLYGALTHRGYYYNSYNIGSTVISVDPMLYKTVADSDAQQQFSQNDEALGKLDTSGEICDYIVSGADATTVNFHHRNDLQTVCVLVCNDCIRSYICLCRGTVISKKKLRS
jgi:hypothetical protein